MIPVSLVGLPLTYPGLVDSGTWRNRFDRAIAADAGLDLSHAERSTIGLGGFTSEALTVSAPLRLRDQMWRAPVSFCDPWPLDFQLLGLEGFFRFFRVEIRAAQYTVEVVAEG